MFWYRRFFFLQTPLFGQGVYLSSELLVSLPYSSTGFGWGKSLMGAELSIVALCEVLDHPSTHCQVKGNIIVLAIFYVVPN